MTTIARKFIAFTITMIAFIILLSGTAGTFSVFILAIAGLAAITVMNEDEELLRPFSVRGFLTGWGLSIGALLFASLLSIMFKRNAIVSPIALSHVAPLIMIVGAIVPNLIGEELYTLTIFKVFGGGWLGWTVSTLAFVIAHGIKYPCDNWQLLSLILIRLALTKIMTRYGVMTSTVLHISYDIVFILPQLL